jgi:hypothetical protein
MASQSRWSRQPTLSGLTSGGLKSAASHSLVNISMTRACHMHSFAPGLNDGNDFPHIKSVHHSSPSFPELVSSTPYLISGHWCYLQTMRACQGHKPSHRSQEKSPWLSVGPPWMRLVICVQGFSEASSCPLWGLFKLWISAKQGWDKERS